MKLPVIRLIEAEEDYRGHAQYVLLQFNEERLTVALGFSMEELRRLWFARNSYVGGIASISYNTLSPTGFPLHCVVEELVPNPDYNIALEPFDKRDAIAVFKDIK